MLKKELKFEDYFGNDRQLTCYFGFTKTELTMMQASSSGGLENTLKNIIETDDNEKIMKWFEEIVISAYGVKSDDGMEFDKSPEVKKKFKQSPAFDVLMMELLSDTEKAIEFVKGIMPKGVKITDADVETAKKELPGATSTLTPVNK